MTTKRWRRAAIIALALAPTSLLSLGLAAGFLERDARASVSISIAFDDLVKGSVSAGVMTPVEQYATWENGRVYTYTRVHVDNAIAGDLGTGAEAWVVTAGGTIDKITQWVDGEAVLTVGTPSLLFIKPDPKFPGLYMTTSRGQGQYTVVTDQQTQTQRLVIGSGHGMVLPPPSKAQASTATTPVLARDAIHGHRLDETIRNVAVAWGRLHAK